MFYELICAIYSDIFDNFKELYPQLLEAKWTFEIVFLVCVGFDNYEISHLLGLEKILLNINCRMSETILRLGYEAILNHFFLINRKKNAEFQIKSSRY
jgi:hypothetical protein